MNRTDAPAPVLMADDLTGALDAGVQMAGRFGRPVYCVWRTDQLQPGLPDGVLIIDTESRNISRSEAVASVSAWAALLRGAGRQVDFKKIDSTLRGHVAAELDAVLDGAPLLRGALVCPALPGQGRLVQDGRLYVHGIPLEDTGLARDPLAPVPSGRLADVLSSSAHPIRHVQTSIPFSPDPDHVVLYTADASDPQDLEHWADQARKWHLLPVGSAGLASVWPETPAARPVLPERRTPMAVVCGTPANATRLQVETLQQTVPLLKSFRPSRKTLLAPEDDPSRMAELEYLSLTIRDVLQAGQSLLLDFVHMEKKDISEAEGDPETIRTGASRILSAMRKLAPALDAAGSLVFLGGDTARTLLDAAQATAVEICGEFLPQIPAGRVVGGAWDGRTVLTKAGGFGDRQTLVRLLSGASGS